MQTRASCLTPALALAALLVDACGELALRFDALEALFVLDHDGGVDVAHVGDSRAYVIRSGQIYPLTRDHSMVQAMIDAFEAGAG